jgi:hypothetical protein
VYEVCGIIPVTCNLHANPFFTKRPVRSEYLISKKDPPETGTIFQIRNPCGIEAVLVFDMDIFRTRYRRISSGELQL